MFLCAKNKKEKRKKSIGLLINNLRKQESETSRGARSQGNISAKKKKGDGCQKLRKVQKKIPHREKNLVDFGPIC